ncbi:hypothetical protein AVEN_30207-1 [Araneus ventricosus]|uniref:Uncharacterized protein n=1 Tax=Araneus ventricosus TaxID=182803 RepID=A0A4Y2I7T3_ARAVE|nr:hypothetical protein AVEN_30207-1 [Araneus ventricosus]
MEEIPENQCIAYDGGVGLCRPAGLCVFRFDSVKDLEESACTMDNGKIGNCCPSKPPPSRVNVPLETHTTSAEGHLFPTKHLKTLRFSCGDKKFNICTKCNMIEATPQHLLDCVALVYDGLLKRPDFVLEVMKANDLMDLI